MALSNLPNGVRSVIDTAARDPELNYPIRAMKARASDFSSRDHAIMVGASMVPQLRAAVDTELATTWLNEPLPESCDELIVGGGLHAAAYATARHQSGFPKPVVIERDFAGGVFAKPGGTAFYLNSRNRPGGQSLPGDGRSLNFLPGATLQPCDMSGTEFQNNEDLAFCIRMALAENAHVHCGHVVDGYQTTDGVLEVIVGQHRIRTGRILYAVGLGKSRRAVEDDRVLSWTQFMNRIATAPFPLRDMRRVAVVGAGDSAKTVIEALVGQGPCGEHNLTSGLDYVEQIDWWGKVPASCEQAQETLRTRYKRLAGLLPANGQPSRVKPQQDLGVITTGFGCAYVNQNPYDYVIDATGFDPWDGTPAGSPYEVGGVVYGERVNDSEVYVIGAAAAPEITLKESRAIRAVKENRVSAFRLVPRTAALATMLRKPSTPQKPELIPRFLGTPSVLSAPGDTITMKTTLVTGADGELVVKDRDEGRAKDKIVYVTRKYPDGVEIGGLDLRVGDRVRGGGYTCDWEITEIGPKSMRYRYRVKNTERSTTNGFGDEWRVTETRRQARRRIVDPPAPLKTFVYSPGDEFVDAATRRRWIFDDYDVSTDFPYRVISANGTADGFRREERISEFNSLIRK